MSKIPLTLCGMPWNVKKSIVDSLEFLPRTRLGQCSTEFKQMIDSAKIQFDYVDFRFLPYGKHHEKVEILVYQNGKKQLKLEFIEISETIHKRKVNNSEGVIENGHFIAAAVSTLLQKINKPKVFIRNLRIFFLRIRGVPYEKLTARNEKLIRKMTDILNIVSVFNPKMDKVPVKRASFHSYGNLEFVGSFLSFLEKKTLVDIRIEYVPIGRSKQVQLKKDAENALFLLNFMQMEHQRISMEVVTIDVLGQVIEMMTTKTFCNGFCLNYTDPDDAHLHDYLSQWPIDPSNRNSRMLTIPNSKNYISVEISSKRLLFERIFV